MQIVGQIRTKPGLALGMGMELFQEAGRLKIKPHTENWTSTFQHG
jgi:hypothetical protein